MMRSEQPAVATFGIVFASIAIEALPFILVGAAVSAARTLTVSPSAMWCAPAVAASMTSPVSSSCSALKGRWLPGAGLQRRQERCGAAGARGQPGGAAAPGAGPGGGRARPAAG
jgi:hypothetical protein